MSEASDAYEVEGHAYVTSALGNAYFSGLSFDMLWECVVDTNTPQELDDSVTAAIRAKDIVDKMAHKRE